MNRRREGYEDVTGDTAATAQTLSRGIRILEFLAERGAPTSIPDITAGVGLHRSITYRLLRTLELHRLVDRDEHGSYALGPRLAALAASVDRDIQSTALPELRQAAEDLGATCFLVVLDRDEVVTLVSVEPSRSRVTVAEHPGTRHPLGIGGPGRAVAAQLPVAEWPPAGDQSAIAAVLQDGYATSHDEVIPGLRSVAVPLKLRGYQPMAIAVVYVSSDLTESELADRLQTAAVTIRAAGVD